MKLSEFILFLLIIVLTAKTLTAQDTIRGNGFDFRKLKPIVQVFGTANYDIKNNHYSFSFGRAHLGLQYQFNPAWSAKIIIDRGRATTVGNIEVNDTAGNNLNVENPSKEGAFYTMYLKFASLQWKVNEKLTLEGGAILQNHYITQERFWGLRYVAQTFQDLYWNIPSSDLGFIAYYKINKYIAFDAAVTNGEGPRIQQDGFGKIKMAGGLDVNLSQKIQIRFYYHNRQNGIDSLSTEQMFSVFTGYKISEIVRIGGEFNYLDNLNYATGADSYGFSVYSAYRILKGTQLFIRYDRLINKENSDFIADNEGDSNIFIGGVSYSPVDGINLSLNYQGWFETHATANSHILFSFEYKL